MLCPSPSASGSLFSSPFLLPLYSSPAIFFSHYILLSLYLRYSLYLRCSLFSTLCSAIFLFYYYMPLFTVPSYQILIVGLISLDANTSVLTMSSKWERSLSDASWLMIMPGISFVSINGSPWPITHARAFDGYNDRLMAFILSLIPRCQRRSGPTNKSPKIGQRSTRP